MKTLSNIWFTRFFAVWATLLAGAVIFLSSAVQASEPTKGSDKGFLEKMDQWQQKMSEKFRDSWKNFRDKNEKSKATVSVDLREDSHNYTVRVNLPDRDLAKVDIKLEGDALTIIVPSEGKTARYEQTITLAGVTANSEMNVDRRSKDDIIVITVPKGNSLSANKPSVPSTVPGLSPPSGWDRDMMEQMEKVRREMDRVFSEAFREFRNKPEHLDFFDEPRFSSALDLKEEGDNYVVRAYLPNRDMQQINVSLEGQTLKIQAKEEQISKKEEAPKAWQSARKAAYSQVLALPGPVETEKMQVERKEGMLVVTIPKKK